MMKGLPILLFSVLLCPAAAGLFAQAPRAVPDSVAASLKQSAPFRYANDPSFWQRPKSDPHSLDRLWRLLWASNAIHWILYVLAASLVIFVIVKVIQSNNFFELRRRKKSVATAAAGDDAIPQDLDARLQDAIRQGHLRLAVRLFYLQTLQRLDSLRKITLQAKATNHDYVIQMNAQPEAAAFRRLTGIYEYVWYGEFDPTPAQFETIRHRFDQFNGRA